MKQDGKKKGEQAAKRNLAPIIVGIVILAAIVVAMAMQPTAKTGREETGVEIPAELLKFKLPASDKHKGADKFKKRNKRDWTMSGQAILDRSMPNGCTSCHSLPANKDKPKMNIPNMGGNQATGTGPSLVGVGERYTKQLGSEEKAWVWLYNHICEPKEFPGFYTKQYNDKPMPAGLKGKGLKGAYGEQEIACIVEYLMSLK